jgi:hypothetical protein
VELANNIEDRKPRRLLDIDELDELEAAMSPAERELAEAEHAEWQAAMEADAENDDDDAPATYTAADVKFFMAEAEAKAARRIVRKLDGAIREARKQDEGAKPATALQWVDMSDWDRNPPRAPVVYP